MLEDRLLVWKLRRGHRDALQSVYEKYKDSLRTIAASMLHDTHAAEDILHDVFVAFAEKVGRLQINTSLRNYLTTCVVNRVRDEYRRKQPQPLELDKTTSISSDSKCPEGQLTANEKAHLLADALAAIPFEQREVIVLRLKGGLKFREISRVQKTSISTVQGRYKYGLSKLRTILDGEFGT